MILNALYDCYKLLADDPDCGIAAPGYSQVACSFALNLRGDGTVTAVYPLTDGKKRRPLLVPEQKNRPGKTVTPYFLCDKSKYLLGREYDKGKKAMTEGPAFAEASLDLHQRILSGIQEPGVQAVVAFLRKVAAEGYRLETEDSDPIYQGGFIVFRLDGESGFIHERPLVRAAWEAYFQQSQKADGDVTGQCLITGETGVPIAQTHEYIKGISGANPSGGAIVSFNAKAYESYGKVQSNNAPVSKQAMFRYTTALNYLLSQRENRILFGETTMILWTSKAVKGNETSLAQVFLTGSTFFDGGDGPKTGSEASESESDDGAGSEPGPAAARDFDAEKVMRDVIHRTRMGWNIAEDVEAAVDFGTTTYILGLSPNNARLAVRFWYRDTLGAFTQKMAQHYCDMEIAKSAKAREFASIRDILKAMAVQEDLKNVPATVEQGLFHSIFSGTMYPQAVYNQILMRIRNEAGKDYGVNNYIRVGFIKAFLLRYYRTTQLQNKEEEITVSLNLESTDVAYNLGRLFAVLELLQSRANNGNTNIRANYFSSASTTPQSVFPRVLQLSQKHIEKTGYEAYWDRRIGELLIRIDNHFPATLSLIEQGTFILGYYHQKQYDYMSKEEKRNDDK